MYECIITFISENIQRVALVLEESVMGILFNISTSEKIIMRLLDWLVLKV